MDTLKGRSPYWTGSSWPSPCPPHWHWHWQGQLSVMRTAAHLCGGKNTHICTYTHIHHTGMYIYTKGGWDNGTHVCGYRATIIHVCKVATEYVK